MDNVDVADITEQARDLIATAFGLSEDELPDVPSTTTIPAWDSLHHLTLIVALEEQFGVTYTSEEIPHMTDLQAITRVTAHHLQIDAAV